MTLSGLLFADPWNWLWWAGAGVLLVVELMSGTFYLLMIALGLVAGGLARLAGVSWSGQLVVAAVWAVLAIAGVRSWRRRRHRRTDGSGGVAGGSGYVLRDDPEPGVTASGAPADAAMNLDIGARVYVARWDGGRGRARYRGADWDVAPAAGVAESVGWYRIQRIDGICLILAH
ncbi:NfeD family protein [Robbsia sp. Bb-Pol-6]|uniref:NfeD family protein n=1 Tax=Robbsia betulipollinis TaxID=2981849 RepID=A0ABT3ZIW1_9BURK|nr:NfeD family protein [Robbsia betulipollinis]MCY0386297.1 NfeD family protein [Robbsia betulipollinis]